MIDRRDDKSRKSHQNYKTSQSHNEKTFTFIDLYAGIGGFRKAFEKVGGRCIFTSEWDTHAKKTYTANFGEPSQNSYQFVGDIQEYADNPEKIPKHDVLLAGFPCQPFSLAGISKRNSLGLQSGFLCETEGTAFHNIAKILEHCRPPAFLLENVKNIVNHDKGRTFTTILNILQLDLKYKIQYKIIDSQSWVPQKRQRIFIAGFQNHDGFVMPEASELLHDKAIPPPTNISLGDILEINPHPKYTITEPLWEYLQSYKDKHRKAGNGFGYSVFRPNEVTRTLSARYYKDGSEILIDQHPRRPRRLTPRECSRLMGFDSPAGAEFKIPVSDTQAYKQFGNAVVVPVVETIAHKMKRHILRAMNNKVGSKIESVGRADTRADRTLSDSRR